VDDSSITYVPCSDAKPETELSALAAVYKLCLDSRARKEAATSLVSRHDDARMDQDAGIYCNYT
jgi:hypothetical protein